MPKGIYKRTSKQLKYLRKRMLEIRIQEFGFQKGHKINLGEKSPNWKGDEVSYGGLHKWVRFHKPIPKRCQICKKIRKLQASNISGKYKREVSDWQYICARCHVYLDGTVNNLKLRHKKS